MLKKLLPRSSLVWTPLFACLFGAVVYQAFTTYLLRGVGDIEIEREPGGVIRLVAGAWGFSALVGAVAYGVHRVAGFHPLWKRDYLEWLRMSPWDGTQRLPLGPVGLVWQDLVYLAVPAACAVWSGTLNVLYVLGTFLATITVLHSITIAYYQRPGRVFVVLSLMAAALLVLFNPDLFVALSGLACIVAMHAVIRDLIRVSRDETPITNASISRFATSLKSPLQISDVRTDSRSVNAERPIIVRIGWPAAILAPQFEWTGITRKQVFALASLVGMYAFSFSHIAEVLGGVDDQQEPAIASASLVLAGIIGLVAVLRIGSYAAFCASPISLWGRLLTGRFIIPAYDRIWMLPLLGLIATFFLAYTGFSIIGICPLAISIGLALGVVFVLLPGPTFEEWFLIGKMRVRGNPTGHRNTTFQI